MHRLVGLFDRDAKEEAQAIRTKAEQEAARTRSDANADARAGVARAEATLAERQGAATRPPQPERRHTPRAPTSTRQPDFRRRFKAAKSGNGFVRSIQVDGWWVRCWVGSMAGQPHASVFAPSKNGVDVQDGPLMEQDLKSETEAFQWIHEADSSGEILREARRAIRLFQSTESFESPEDDDIPF